MLRGLIRPLMRFSSLSIDLRLSEVGGRFRVSDSLAGDVIDLGVRGLVFVLVNCEAKLLSQPLCEIFTWLGFCFRRGWNSVSALRGRSAAAG